MEERELALLAAWLERRHVREWWREPIERELSYGVEGRYLIAVDGRPVGMIQTYDSVEAGVAEVDLLIGEDDLVGIGLGPQVLAQFAREVVFALPEATAVTATVEEPNRRSWRAFEKAGFRHVGDIDEAGLPHRLMRLDRH